MTIRHGTRLRYKQFLTTFTTVITQHITQKDEINTICTRKAGKSLGPTSREALEEDGTPSCEEVSRCGAADDLH